MQCIILLSLTLAFAAKWLEMGPYQAGDHIHCGETHLQIYPIIGVGFYLRKTFSLWETSKNISTIAIHECQFPVWRSRRLFPILLTHDQGNCNHCCVLLHDVLPSIGSFGVGVLVGCPRNWWVAWFCVAYNEYLRSKFHCIFTNDGTANIFQKCRSGVLVYHDHAMDYNSSPVHNGSCKLIEYDFKWTWKWNSRKKEMKNVC